MRFELASDFVAKLAQLEALDPVAAEMLRSKIALMRQACEGSDSAAEMLAALERLGIEMEQQP